MATNNYDLIVIGSGPAGEKGAAQAAYFGKRVALVEKDPPPLFGGAAANTGTLPSKTLRETALFLSGFQHRELDGLEARLKDRCDIKRLMNRRKVVVGKEHKRIDENLHRHGVTVYRGDARFAGPHTVAVRRKGAPETLLTGDVILIATGSRPFRPENFRVDDPRIVDSDTILEIPDIPKRLLVVGGGVIGCEYACMFSIMGAEVLLIEERERLLGSVDFDISDALAADMRKNGIKIRTSDKVAKVDYAKTGKVDYAEPMKVTLVSGDTIETEMILVSAGRSGNTASLDLDRLGVLSDDRGRIPVDQAFQTSIPYVYAAGDVIKGPALASSAMEQGRMAMINAFQLEYMGDRLSLLPYGIYTIPECSMVGPTEQQLLEQGVPHVVGKATYDANARGHIIGDDDGFLKLIFREEDMKLLAIHVIGEGATELIHIGLVAIQLNATAELFIKTCFNYPTLSEMYKYATYDALGRRAKQRAAAKK
jgi:NAD(P) transhydrogenase